MNIIPLPQHAERINAHHDAAQAAAQSAIEHALQAGQLLIEVKASLAHGELTAWINQYCRFSARTAQAYMRLAKKMPTLDAAKAQRVAGLSLREAMKAIAAPGTEQASSDTPLSFLLDTGIITKSHYDLLLDFEGFYGDFDDVRFNSTEPPSTAGLDPASAVLFFTHALRPEDQPGGFKPPQEQAALCLSACDAMHEFIQKQNLQPKLWHRPAWYFGLSAGMFGVKPPDLAKAMFSFQERVRSCLLLAIIREPVRYDTQTRTGIEAMAALSDLRHGGLEQYLDDESYRPALFEYTNDIVRNGNYALPSMLQPYSKEHGVYADYQALVAEATA
ncbi:MAG: DUF3102 domain-containing protein [Candidatus Competibacteraceae bacterium]|nr:DUF3102 domain-containing protein [Candidatus Competibacteraceae bacterium]